MKFSFYLIASLLLIPLLAMVSCQNSSDDDDNDDVENDDDSDELEPASCVFQVNDHQAGGPPTPDVAMDVVGNFVVTYHTMDNGGMFLAQRFDATGNKVGNEIQVNTTEGGLDRDAKVFMDPFGNFVVLWPHLDLETEYTYVLGQRFDSDGNRVEGEFQLGDDYGVDNLVYMEGNDNGEFIVAWMDNETGANDRIYARPFDESGNPICDDIVVEDDFDRSPLAAIDNTGRFVLFWAAEEKTSDDTKVYGKFYDSQCNPLGDSFAIDEETGVDQIPLSLAMNGEGRFVVIWYNNPVEGSGDTGIFAQIFDENFQTVHSEISLSPEKFGAYPKIALKENGKFLVVWERDESSKKSGNAPFDTVYESNIVAIRYDENGQPLEEEFQVTDTGLVNLYGQFDLAMSDTWRFVVVWWDTEIYARLYSSEADPECAF